MLLKIPFQKTGKLLKHRRICEALEYASKHHIVSMTEMKNELGLGTKHAWSLLHDLARAGFLNRRKRKYEVTDKIRNDYVLLNLRDVRSDRLYKCKAMRTVLFHFSIGNANLMEIARETGVSYPTLLRAVKMLREAGIVSGTEIRPEFLYVPKDPVELIPREEHRKAIRYFLHSLKAAIQNFTEPIVFFGEASFGKTALTLKVALLVKPAKGPERMLRFLRGAMISAENVTAHFGALMELTAIVEDAWLMQKLGIISPPDQTILETYRGICIHGILPRKEDFFQLSQLSHPFPSEKIQESLAKGYLKPRKNGSYAYTEKALKIFREHPLHITEIRVPVDRKEIRLLTIRQHINSVLRRNELDASL